MLINILIIVAAFFPYLFLSIFNSSLTEFEIEGLRVICTSKEKTSIVHVPTGINNQTKKLNDIAVCNTTLFYPVYAHSAQCFPHL